MDDPSTGGRASGTARVRSWWGWGWADQVLDEAACRRLAERTLRPWMPVDGTVTPVPAVPVLPVPRLVPPSTLDGVFVADSLTRASHAYGKSFRDVVRALAGRLDHPPDLVAYPRSRTEVVAVLDWAEASGAAVVPYGGGTSVVGGVECRTDRPVVTLDLSRLDRVIEVDETSRAACIQAGVPGPALEAQLKPYGLTLRHYPQSFEFSTLGGWLATRAGGHYATGYTHIDDYVEALRVVTPLGLVETLRVPASGAGPAPDRLFLGSEGTLGVIIEAWLRVLRRPRFTASAAVGFPAYPQAVTATREIAQSDLRPSNCRLLDPLEAMIQAGAGDGWARLLLGFESAEREVGDRLAAAVEICRAHGGEPDSAPTPVRGVTEAAGGGPARGTGGGTGGGTVGTWRESFLRAPYLRDALVRLGLVVETFETACTWSHFDDLHAAVLAAVTAAAPAGVAMVTCRFTHVYPDGPAPYFTVMAPGRRGAEVRIWDEIKAAASEAISAHGGTITHHHSVGRDHRPWYDRERPEPFAAALRAAKAALDPRGILNPGVLVD
jgi:alkyldihydroxyacetonephosphate synthase